MKYWTKILTSLVVIAALLAAIKGLQYLEEKSAQKEAAEKKLLDFKVDDVVDAKLANTNGTFIFTKADNNWKLTEPKATFEIDSSVVSDLLSEIDRLDSEKFIIEEFDSAKRKDFGFEPSPITLELTLKNSQKLRLEIGKKMSNDENANYYALSSQHKKLFVLSNSTVNNLNKKLIDFRNKKIHNFKIGEIYTVRITQEGKPDIEVTRAGTEWKIKKPDEFSTDSIAVDDYLQSLEQLYVDNFLSESESAPSNFKNLHLDPPTAKIELLPYEGAALATVVIGKTDDFVYLLQPDGAVARLAGYRWNTIEPDLKKFRQLKVLSGIALDDAKSVTINEKNFIKEGSSWYENAQKPAAQPASNKGETEVSPPAMTATPTESSQKEKDIKNNDKNTIKQSPKKEATKLGDLINSLTTLKAEEVFEKSEIKELSAYGLDKPRYTLQIEFADSKKPGEKLLIGKTLPEKENQVYIKRMSIETIFVIEAGEILKHLKSLTHDEGGNK